MAHSETTTELVLPEDHPYALIVICKLVHFCCNDVPESVDVDILIEVATLADKYECTGAVRLIARQWMRTLADKTVDRNAVPFDKLSLAAFLLRDPSYFEEMGTNLLLHTTSHERPEGLPSAMQKYLSR